MGTYRSKEDDTTKISTSIFVTNFPESFNAKDLFHACKVYGHVVDSYIPTKRTKAGKRFGFVRFINVFNVERLVNNLDTVWVGSFKLHTNVARFQRPPLNGNPPLGRREANKTNVSTKSPPVVAGGYSSSNKSFASVLKHNAMPTDTTSNVVLDDDCINTSDLSLSLFGRVKEVDVLSNITNIIGDEGFGNVSIHYLGELWLMISFSNPDSRDEFLKHTGIASWFSTLHHASSDFSLKGRLAWVEVEGVPFKFWTKNTFKRIASKWGHLLAHEDSDVGYYSKRICISTTMQDNILESFKLVFKGKSFGIRAKEIPGWVPELSQDSDDNSSYEDELSNNDGNLSDKDNHGDLSELEVVEETIFDNPADGRTEKSDDPFDIYGMLNKENNKELPKGSVSSSSQTHPPGFTPKAEDPIPENIDNQSPSVQAANQVDGSSLNKSDCREDKIEDHSPQLQKNDQEGTHILEEQIESLPKSCNSGTSGHFKISQIPRTGGSILHCMEELVKVGQTMGYNMEGCENDIMKIIESQGADEVNR
ncbi:nucleotide-binding alpha-beta plait domain-containing protein [Tanacetum coccineum]|uniref:Nucleotide-binding alpha-beta plait domain-containing protein n=1 Tax=Tanacetum coccineum TaxID=301880 RepID=A0ABQ4WWG4_9ASTR